MRTLTLSACLALVTTTTALAVAPSAAQAQAQAPAKTVRMPATVFFDYDDDQLSAEMREYLDVVAQRFAAEQPGGVIVSAHADRREARSLGTDYVVGLSQRRANVVRDYLVVRGVAPGVITTQAFGHTRPNSDTSQSEDRRVVIEFGPGSGW